MISLQLQFRSTLNMFDVQTSMQSCNHSATLTTRCSCVFVGHVSATGSNLYLQSNSKSIGDRPKKFYGGRPWLFFLHLFRRAIMRCRSIPHKHISQTSVTFAYTAILCSYIYAVCKLCTKIGFQSGPDKCTTSCFNDHAYGKVQGAGIANTCNMLSVILSHIDVVTLESRCIPHCITLDAYAIVLTFSQTREGSLGVVQCSLRKIVCFIFTLHQCLVVI